MGMSEIGAMAPTTYLLKRGELKARGAEVAPKSVTGGGDERAKSILRHKNGSDSLRRARYAA